MIKLRIWSLDALALRADGGDLLFEICPGRRRPGAAQIGGDAGDVGVAEACAKPGITMPGVPSGVHAVQDDLDEIGRILEVDRTLSARSGRSGCGCAEL